MYYIIIRLIIQTQTTITYLYTNASEENINVAYTLVNICDNWDITFVILLLNPISLAGTNFDFSVPFRDWLEPRI